MTVNILDAGADNTGSQSINSVLDGVVSNGAEIYFPEGTYRLDPVTYHEDNLTLRGNNATLLVPDGVTDTWLFLGGDGWVMDGFTIDISGPEVAPTQFLRGSDWEFKNITYKGQMGDPDERSNSNMFYPAVESADGTGLMKNVRAPEGASDPDGSSNRGLLWLGSNNAGHLTFEGCHFRHFANNTLYVEGSNGPITIDGCVFEDTNVGLRVSGNTVIKNTKVLQTGKVPAQRWTGGRAGRGLWLGANSTYDGEIVVDNCDFVMTGENATAAIEDGGGSVESLVVTNSRFQTSGQSAISMTDHTHPSVDISGSSFINGDINVNGSGSVDDSCLENASINGLSSSGISSGSCERPSEQYPWNEDGSDSESGSDSDSGSEPTYDYELAIRGTGVASKYEIVVDGEIVGYGDTIERWDSISETSVTGWVTGDGAVDEFRFNGSVTEFTVHQGDVDIWLDGTQVTKTELLNQTSDDESGTDTDQELQEKIASLETEIASLEDEKASLQSQIDSLEATQKSLKEKRDSLESEVSTLESRNSSLRMDNDSLRDKISRIKEIISS